MADHLPVYSGAQLRAALSALERLPISSGAKALLIDMLTEASLPNREDFSRLPAETVASIEQGIEDVTDHTKGVMARARADMLALSDAEWDALVEEAARDR